MLILLYEPSSLLERRFAKTIIKQERFFAKLMNNLQEILKPFSEQNAKTSDYISKSKKLLLQAGYASSEEDVIKYDARKLANVVVAGVLLLILLIISFSINMLIISVLTLYLVYKWPEMKLKKEIKIRQKEFMKYLPDAVDLLSICVQAGLGMDAAFEKVAEEFTLTSKTVSVEFSRLNKDILSGFNREDAYKNLILRNQNPDLQSFVALLIQTERLGTSITQSLDAFCDAMRTRKRQRIEELSQQVSTKMTIPMVLFMLPAIFIIIMYPAIQKIMVSLGH
ncbi:MAG: type II secretion system F family protein [Candidatus Gastranaerophilales bacterium]|nr:type II secretion system F family protein [Candidatus Gastranaerophilales bacterium]